MADLPGKELARELIGNSQAESRATHMEDVIQSICDDGLGDDAAHRLLGRLWTLERMFYYIYGGWGQGLEINDFPPSVKYLFSKQIVDESTQEMLYLDAQLHRGVFESQFVENRSHINMGRRIVEEFVKEPIDAELCRWAWAVAKRDYGRFLGELSAFVLGRKAPEPPAPRRQVTD